MIYAKLCAYCAGTSGIYGTISTKRILLSGKVSFLFAQRVSLVVPVLLFEQGVGTAKSTSGALSVLICGTLVLPKLRMNMRSKSRLKEEHAGRPHPPLLYLLQQVRVCIGVDAVGDRH